MPSSLVENLTASSALTGTEYIYGYDSVSDVHIRPSQILTYLLAHADTAELIRDVIGATLVAGTNVTITVDDSPNTITISATGGGGSGDVVGPASATDNALARFDATTGKLVQNSGVIVDDSNNISGVGTFASGAQTITSSSAAAVVVGANGATNPALTVDASTASSATGVAVKSAAAGGNVTITATSSGTNEGIRLVGKGSGVVTLRCNGTDMVACATNNLAFTTSTRSAANVPFTFTLLSGTALTASTEATALDVNMSATQQHATGALTTQRDFRVRNATHSAVGASTITTAATLAVDGAPIAGTNATITNSSAIYSPGAAVGAGVTNSYGLNITANSGATNNYAMRLAGAAGELVGVRTDGQIAFLATNTAGGTTGAQTINKPSGTVNFAAAATSLVVTNSLCTTSSIVFAEVRTNDSTAQIKNVVPGSGSFTINLSAAATAETSVGFFIIN